MEEIIRFYKQQSEALQTEINALSRRIHLVGTIRLLLVIGAAIAIYLFREQSWTVLTGIALVFIVPFAALMLTETTSAMVTTPSHSRRSCRRFSGTGGSPRSPYPSGPPCTCRKW